MGTVSTIVGPVQALTGVSSSPGAGQRAHNASSSAPIADLVEAGADSAARAADAYTPPVQATGLLELEQQAVNQNLPNLVLALAAAPRPKLRLRDEQEEERDTSAGEDEEAALLVVPEHVACGPNETTGYDAANAPQPGRLSILG
jgi:hypothetical protein